MDLYQVLKRPYLTEKTYANTNHGQRVAFVVHNDANKSIIREAIEKLFAVKVQKINIIVKSARQRRMGKYNGTKKAFKRAHILLKPNYSLSFFDFDKQMQPPVNDVAPTTTLETAGLQINPPIQDEPQVLAPTTDIENSTEVDGKPNSTPLA